MKDLGYDERGGLRTRDQESESRSLNNGEEQSNGDHHGRSAKVLQDSSLDSMEDEISI